MRNVLHFKNLAVRVALKNTPFLGMRQFNSIFAIPEPLIDALEVQLDATCKLLDQHLGPLRDRCL